MRLDGLSLHEAQNCRSIDLSWHEQAAQAARRALHPDWHWGALGAIYHPGVLMVNSRIFGKNIGTMHNYDPETGMADVSLELPDDHPSMRDALGDNPGMHPDTAEFIDRVPLSAIVDNATGLPLPAPLPPVVAVETATRPIGPRVSTPMPELDAALRTRYQ